MHFLHWLHFFGSSTEPFTCFPEEALNGSIIDRFSEVTARFPDRPVIGDGMVSYRYRDLARLARRIAVSVPPATGRRTEPVGILLRNEPRYAAAMLGIMASGRAFVPLNADHPFEHSLRILAHARATALISDSERIAAFGAAGPPGVSLLNLDAIGRRARHRPVPALPDDLACIAYTSGSTGRPKGVERHHRALLHYAMQTVNAMEIGPSDTLVSFNGPSLTEGLIVTLCALLTGASVHCLSPAAQQPPALAARLRASGATVLWTVPRLFRHLVDALPAGLRFDSLRLVSLAGDRVDWRDIDTVRRGCLPGTPVRVGFGSTEAGVHSQWFVDEAIRADSSRVPVGREPPGQRLSLIGEDGSPVPDGDVGEVEVASASVAKAYWGDPEATARTFLPVPGNPTVHRYRTGDLARRRPDGLIEYVGRKDGQIKLRGQRVEVTEVEGALVSCPGIRDAAVTVRRDAAGVPRSLLAWCEPEPGQTVPQPRALIAMLADRLPRHMVPAAVEMLRELPRLANFKIDREMLRLRDELMRRAQPAETPSTPTEALLAALWTEALETTSIARDDDFFELGGDSLAAATVSIGVRDATGQDIDLGLLAEHTTLADLAAAIDEARNDAAPDDRPLVPVSRDRPPPMSFVQEAVWRDCPTTERTAPYCDTTAYRLRGDLNVDALRAAIGELITRHEMLRTTFDVVDGRLVQIVHAKALADVAFADVSGNADPTAEARRLVRGQRKVLVSLRTGPLVRFLLIRLGKDEHWLVQSTNHIVSDASSRALFFRELGLSYDARLQRLPSPLTASPSLQYGDYATWQRSAIHPDAPRYKADIAWWCERLASLPPPPTLPFQRQAPAADADSGEATIRWSMRPETARRTIELAREMRTTPFAVRLAAFSTLLAAEIGCPTVVLATHLDRRDRVVLRETIGSFVNIAALRLDSDPRASFAAWVGTVADTVTDAMAHGGVPFWSVLDALWQRGISYPFGILVHSFVLARPALRGIEAEIVDRDSTGMPCGFTLAFREHDEDRDCSIAFDPRVYDPAKVRAFRDRFVAVLEEGLADPERPLASLVPSGQPAPV